MFAVALAPAGSSSATTIVPDIDAPAHASQCRFADGAEAFIIRYVSDDYDLMTIIERDGDAHVAVFEEQDGRQLILSEENNPLIERAMIRLRDRLINNGLTLIGRGERASFQGQEGKPDCGWPSLLTLLREDSAPVR